MAGSIVVVVVLTCCVLFHPRCGLKVAQMNRQLSLIQELNVFQMGYHNEEATVHIFV